MPKKNPSLLQTVTKDPAVIADLRKAFAELYDQDSRVVKGKEKEAESFQNWIHSPQVGIPESLPVKDTGILLEHLYENYSQVPEYSEGTTTTTSLPGNVALGQREAQEAERQYRAEVTAESKKTAKEFREEFESQQQVRAVKIREIQERIKTAEAARKKLEEDDKKVYAQVEEKPEPAHEDDQQKQKEVYVAEIKKDPEKAIKTFSKEIQSRIKDVPEYAADIAATELVAHIQGNYSTEIHAAVAQENKDQKIDAEAKQVSAQEKARLEVAKLVVAQAFGEEFKNEFLSDVRVNISQTPIPDYQPVSTTFIPTQYIETAQAQENVLENPQTAQPEWMESWVSREMAKAEAGIQGEGSFNAGVVQGYVTTYTQAPAMQTAWEDSTGPTDLGIASGANQVFGAAGELAKGLTKQVAAKGARKLVTSLAAKLLAPETGGLSIVAEKLITWASNLIDWKKVKEYSAALIGGLAGLIALPFIGLGAAIGVGVGTGFIALGVGAQLGGLTLGGIGAGIINFLGAIASAVLGSIVKPILIILLGFPIAVAIILFIINSGAYVVPPGSSTGVVGFVCNTSEDGGQTPPGAESSAANAAVCIVTYLNKFHINPLLESSLGSSGWQQLLTVLPSAATSALEASSHVDNHLQCIGFVSATAGLAYGQNFGPQNNACAYINNPPPGYRYVSGTGGMKSGDFFVVDGSGGCSTSSPGHIGVVLSVNGALISCADANYTAPGLARVGTCLALDQISGYLRK